jgi:hypothetical protein
MCEGERGQEVVTPRTYFTQMGLPLHPPPPTRMWGGDSAAWISHPLSTEAVPY